MNTFKRLIAAIAIICLAAGTFAVKVSAVETDPSASGGPTIIAEGQCGPEAYWSLNSDGLLEITGCNNMYDYSSTGSEYYPPWYAYHAKIKKVSVADTVNYLGDGAFMQCINLTEINLDGLNTANDLFWNCARLVNVTLPSDCNYIGSNAFGGCYSLRRIVIPDSVKCIRTCAFIGCTNLEKVILPDGLEIICDSAFSNCKKLKEITIPASVYSIEAQYDCFEKIYGYAGTAAETYALENGIEFIDLSSVNGWILIDGIWHYYIDGLMATGWQQVNDKWYYMDDAGNMLTGWQKIGGTWYYFKGSGAMLTGWQKISGTWYYFKSGGAMVKGWQKIDNKWYFFKSSGAMAANEWCEGYWLNASGSWTYQPKGSWYQNSKGWWFGDTSGWYARNTTIRIDNKYYTFNASGYWVK